MPTPFDKEGPTLEVDPKVRAPVRHSNILKQQLTSIQQEETDYYESGRHVDERSRVFRRQRLTVETANRKPLRCLLRYSSKCLRSQCVNSVTHLITGAMNMKTG